MKPAQTGRKLVQSVNLRNFMATNGQRIQNYLTIWSRCNSGSAVREMNLTYFFTLFRFQVIDDLFRRNKWNPDDHDDRLHLFRRRLF